MTKLERFITNIWLVRWLKIQAKRLYIPGFQQVPFYDVVAFFFKQINKVGLNDRAASISFHLIMALPAAVLFLFSIVPYLPKSGNFEKEILKLFNDVTPNSATYSFIKNLLNDLMKKHVGVFSFGFLLVIYYASNAMMGIIRSFDKSIQETKGFFLIQRWRAIQLTFILIFLIIASATMLIGQQELFLILKKLFGLKTKASLPIISFFRWLILIGLLFYGVSFIYKYAPSVKKRWPLVTPGSILTTALFVLTTFVFSYWVNNFAAYNKVYGSIGTVLILMLLIYINSLIFLIGFELNVSINSLQTQARQSKN